MPAVDSPMITCLIHFSLSVSVNISARPVPSPSRPQAHASYCCLPAHCCPAPGSAALLAIGLVVRNRVKAFDRKRREAIRPAKQLKRERSALEEAGSKVAGEVELPNGEVSMEHLQRMQSAAEEEFEQFRNTIAQPLGLVHVSDSGSDEDGSSQDGSNSGEEEGFIHPPLMQSGLRRYSYSGSSHQLVAKSSSRSMRSAKRGRGSKGSRDMDFAAKGARGSKDSRDLDFDSMEQLALGSQRLEVAPSLNSMAVVEEEGTSVEAGAAGPGRDGDVLTPVRGRGDGRMGRGEAKSSSRSVVEQSSRESARVATTADVSLGPDIHSPSGARSPRDRTMVTELDGRYIGSAVSLADSLEEEGFNEGGRYLGKGMNGAAVAPVSEMDIEPDEDILMVSPEASRPSSPVSHS